MTFRVKKHKHSGFPHFSAVIHIDFLVLQASNLTPALTSLIFSIITLTFFVFGAINAIFIGNYDHLTTRP